MAYRTTNPNYGAGRTQALISDLGTSLSGYMNTRAARDQQARIFDLQELQAQQALEQQNLEIAEMQMDRQREAQELARKEKLRQHTIDTTSGMMDALNAIPETQQLDVRIPSVFDPSLPVQDPTLGIGPDPTNVERSQMMATGLPMNVGLAPEGTPTGNVLGAESISPFARMDKQVTTDLPLDENYIMDAVANEEANFIKTAMAQTGATAPEAKAAFQSTLDSIIDASGDPRLRQFGTAGRAAAAERAKVSFETGEEIRKKAAEQKGKLTVDTVIENQKFANDKVLKQMELKAEMGNKYDPAKMEEPFAEAFESYFSDLNMDKPTERAVESMYFDMIYNDGLHPSTASNTIRNEHLQITPSGMGWLRDDYATLASSEGLLTSSTIGQIHKHPTTGKLVRVVRAAEGKGYKGLGFEEVETSASGKGNGGDGDNGKGITTEAAVSATYDPSTSFKPNYTPNPNVRPSVNEDRMRDAQKTAKENLDLYTKNTRKAIATAKAEKNPADIEYFINQIIDNVVETAEEAGYDAAETSFLLKELELLEQFKMKTIREDREIFDIIM